jgi:hypothetical protein
MLFRAILEDPGQKGTPARHQIELIGSFEERAQDLCRLNNQGYGIFYQVNRADGAGWKSKNIVGVTAYFADFDGTPLENAARLELCPHLVVGTSPGKRHFYWRVDEASVPDFSQVQQRLIKVFGSDKSVHDLPRILRLAGFFHWKTGSPRLVSIEQVRDAPAYSDETFLSALNAAEVSRGISRSQKIGNSQSAPMAGGAEELDRAASALRHNIADGSINLGDRSDWINCAIALKATFGPAGLPLFLELSRQAEKFVSDDDCRETWNSIKDEEREAPRLTMATFFAKAMDSGWRYRAADEDEATKKLDPASLVLKLVESEGDERFIDKEGTPFVRFRRRAGDSSAPFVVARIDSELYRGMLRRRFHLHVRTRTLPKEQLNNAVELLRAEAIQRNDIREVHLRAAEHNGIIYVDLGRGDGSAVEINPAHPIGWQVVNEAPVLFSTGARGALPIPEQGATLVDLQRHMPSLDQRDVQRVLGFCIGTFNTQGTYPLLLFSGGQGTNKSTMADMVVALTDPPTGTRDARFSFPPDERDLVIHALHARVLYFDNVSNFSGRESDRLCKLLSGTAFATRTLYANTEEQRFALLRPVIATCIGTPTTRGDLLDRTLPVTAKRTGSRRTEAAVWADFKKDWPKLFGLVLTGVAHALRNSDAIQHMVDDGQLQPPRLADFAQFVEGAADILELPRGEFSHMLREEQGGLQAESAAGDPLGAALLRHLSTRGKGVFVGSASDLLSELAGDAQTQDRYWPPANKLRARLERIQDGLADLGVEVQFYRPTGKRNVFTMRIAATDNFSPIVPPRRPF